MKKLLSAYIILTVLSSYSQTDTIIFEFDSFEGAKYTDGNIDGLTGIVVDCNFYFSRPKVNFDTLKSENGKKPFTGVLITNYRWISNNNPPIFLRTIDGFSNGVHTSHKPEQFRWPKVTTSKGSTDTMFVEFEYLNGCKFVDNGQSIYGYPSGRSYANRMPLVNIDTLRSFDGQTPFNGILVTNYKWISDYNPPFFRTTIDSVVNGKSVNHSYVELRRNNQKLTEGYYNDSISVVNNYNGNSGIIYEKIISFQKDSLTLLTEIFYYFDDTTHKIFEHIHKVNGEYEGSWTIYIDDSLTIRQEYDDGNLVDILNENTIFLDKKNKLISKELFFHLAYSKTNGYASWDIITGSVDGKNYRFIVCKLSEGTYDPFDKNLHEKLIKQGVKRIY